MVSYIDTLDEMTSPYSGVCVCGVCVWGGGGGGGGGARKTIPEVNWSGSTLVAKAGHLQVQQDQGWNISVIRLKCGWRRKGLKTLNGHHMNSQVLCSRENKKKVTHFSPDNFIVHYESTPIQIQPTSVISKSKGFPEILRNIRTSTYQICTVEESINQTTTFHKCIWS